ncbi:hypothetical protein DFO70_10630 [Cytobacillus firmus]|uniref:Uncharacterized protein n=2 Tax=Cytobacillus TaxID=2675230 RepID=A0A366JWC0_CYTFI|nr:hypothetical protein DFO70_10630 [Cytobacillus firmus]TDX42503.1 hypothetical protein DFO72_10630 [Cytobacillus oceanisediminis]
MKNGFTNGCVQKEICTHFLVRLYCAFNLNLSFNTYSSKTPLFFRADALCAFG